MLKIILPNGDMKLSIESDQERFEISELMENCGCDYIKFLYDLLDYTGDTGNGGLHPIAPEDIGALTDAPMFCDEYILKDDGTIENVGNVFWYPYYECRHFGDVLLVRGEVIFEKVK